jgi:lipopolysaccharide transport system ATP-binding protein
MSAPVISVEKLSKRYEIGHQRDAGDGLRHALEDAFRNPFRWISERKKQLQPAREEFWALKDVGFEIMPGEVVGIIGRNGAGKSTLLKILSRITEPTSGRIIMHGRVASLLEVGTGFHQELTGRENIFLNGAILGMSKAEIRRKFDEIVAFSEIEKFLDTPVKRYSSGMYVRLAFAVAAHLEPEILIVDEVLAVGDADFQKKCLGKMRDISGKEGRTVLFVSHNMSAVTQLCAKGIWLKNGQVVKSGDAEEVVRDYLNAGAWQMPMRRWNFPGDAPGDDKIRLLSGKIIQNNETTGVIDINAPIRIEMEFLVLKPAKDLITGVSVYNSSGLCLFNACDWRPNTLAPGTYRKSVEIPRQTMAEDRHSVLMQCVFFSPDIRSVVENDVIQFETIDGDAEDSVKGLVRGSWPGVVRLKLDWTSAEKINL